MIVNGIDYPIETPTYVLNENFRNFAPEGLTTVAVSGDEYTSAIILKTPRYYKNLDLSEYTARAYYYTHWLDDEQKSSESSVPLYNYEVQENNIIYVWQLDINQTYKKGRVDFGLSWSNDDWKLNTKGCYFVVQRFVNTEGGYIAPDIAEQLQAEIDTLFAIKQDKQDESLETEDKTVVGAINELNDFKNRSQGFATSQQGENADTALANTQSLATNKQDKFTNVEDQGGDLHLTPSQSAVYFDGRFRYTPDPNADENKDDIVNRDNLESYHDTTKQDNIAEVQNNTIIFDDKKVVFPQIPTSDSSPSASGDLTTKSYVDNADTNLQQQIDAIASSSDVVDVVGTYTELQQYDTSKLKDNDIIKVLQDESRNMATTYYRWIINSSTHIGSWTYVGSEGPYYTKSETDATFATQQQLNIVDNTILGHMSEKNNPHKVTKTQVGLGNVDNTSDLNKPISYATQIVLNGKVNQVFASWLNSNSGDWDNIYQCLDTGYGFTEGYFYVKKMNPQTAEIYWERIDVQPQTDLSNYYTKSEVYDKTETDNKLAEKADIDGSYDTMSVGNSHNLISDSKISEKVPYNYRQAGGNKRVGNYLQEEIVGGTVVFNQLIDPIASISVNNVLVTSTNGFYTIYGTANASSGRNSSIVKTNIPIINGHKYLKYWTIDVDPADSNDLKFYIMVGTTAIGITSPNIISASVTGSGTLGFNATSGQSYDKEGYIQIFDLTQMFGSTIADYIYTLEQTTTGAGVSYFKSLFPNDYYEYNAGTLMSVKTSAHKIYNNNGDLIVSYPLDSDLELRGIPKLDSNNNLYYDGDIYESDGTVTRNRKRYTMTGEEGIKADSAYYVKTNCCDFYLIPNDIKNASSYPEPYRYTNVVCNRLSTLAINGIGTNNTAINGIGTQNTQIHFNISNSDLGISVHEFQTYADLQAYSTSGLTEADWAIVKTDEQYGNNRRIYLWRDNSWAVQNNYTTITQFYKDYLATQYSNNNPYIIEYELATSTTETATPYANPQYIDNNGYEEYTDTRTIAIPVGHNSQYSQDLRGKIENMPNIPPYDPTKTQTLKNVNGTLQWVDD